jgi:hypothetical protein
MIVEASVKIEEYKCLSLHAQQVDISARLDLQCKFSWFWSSALDLNPCSRTLVPGLYWKLNFVVDIILPLPYLNMEHLAYRWTSQSMQQSLAWGGHLHEPFRNLQTIWTQLEKEQDNLHQATQCTQNCPLHYIYMIWDIVYRSTSLKPILNRPVHGPLC